ncbi:uncharacterized protein LOC107828833 [Nicotiana tabacum]|uniref:Uncharacterized protein LOC107828833 n=1 Tax=Nicotiana tabacum TaxID=4097 RepID=A0A1S4DE21_TOBAC
MAVTNILVIIVVLVASALVLPTNARSLSMKATKAKDEQETLFRPPLPPYLGRIGGHGIGRPAFGVGPGFGGGFGNNPFGGISSGSGLGGGGLGFGAGTGTGFGSSIGGAGGFGSSVGFGNGGGFGFGDDGGSSSNGNGVFAGGQGEGDDAAIGNQYP